MRLDPGRTMRPLWALILVLAGPAAGAAGLDGDKTVYLGDAGGHRIAIGHVTFAPLAPGHWKIRLALDQQLLGEYFLAMRPFRCLQTARRSLCSFPYGTRDEVSEADWSALEYQLIFLHKPAAALSLDARNGMYWKLHREGERLVGALYDADLEPIVVPGPNRDRPLTEEFLQPADLASHPLPGLTIE